MNKIVYILSTYKCSACKCIEYILKEIKEDNPTFDIITSDYTECPGWIKDNLKLTDFPTVIFVKDNIIRQVFVGTKSRKKVEQLIKEINF